MKKRKIVFIIGLVFIWMIGVLAICKSRTKLTYLEYEYLNENAASSVILHAPGDVLEQKFVSPYNVMNGVALKVATFARDNNSIWNIQIIEKKTDRILYSKNYNASNLVDNEFNTFKFDENIILSKDKEYVIQVKPVQVDDNTCLSFYLGDEKDNHAAYYNDGIQHGSLCLAIYGGNTDNWWMFYIVIVVLLISVAYVRGYYLYANQEQLMLDRLFGGTIIAVIVLILLNSFAVVGDFTDEFDNIRGGMIIAHGGVLYRDYVTQHTPVMYYICGFFALLGAKSIEQFRLSYYLLEALIWGGLYNRHKKTFGMKKMILLVILECIFVTSILGGTYGYMILSDGMQGLCMVVLLLEFIEYYKDRTIGWDRSIVISLAVWGSFGSAFISAYAIIVIVVLVIGLEITWLMKSESISFRYVFNRYIGLFISLSVPVILAVLYFDINHSLKKAFEQFYLFNREVYINYGAMGSNFFEPFIASEQNFFGIVADKFNLLITASATNADVIQLIVITVAIAVIVTMLTKKKYIESISLFLVMIFSATRGYSFHGIAAWYVAIMIIALYGEELFHTYVKKIALPASVVVGIYMLSIYAQSVGSNLLYEQQPVSELESRVVSYTKNNEEILIDAYSCDSTYLLYKNRYPANSACYMLPWYMDWYEKDVINDLREKQPRIVIFNPDMEVWGYTNYANAFYTELGKEYKQISDNPDDAWKYKVWVRDNKH
ncbi:MAG: hypothetical protein K6E54_03700 [Bacteroidaceae bacterium]|nr:hypothetical protein [Bacteroidaceae bacterium]